MEGCWRGGHDIGRDSCEAVGTCWSGEDCRPETGHGAGTRYGKGKETCVVERLCNVLDAT